RWMLNSTFVALVVTLTGVALASTAGYALSRYRFLGRGSVLSGLMVTQMFPATMLLLPLYVVLIQLQLLNSYIGLIIIYTATALPFCVWQMKGYYDTIPFSLEEAARIDGCSPWQAFYKVVFPLAAPALVITALFSFMTAWNEFVIANVVIQDAELFTLPLGLKLFQGTMVTQWGLYAAGALIVSIPVVILFLVLSRYLIGGLTLGAVKGGSIRGGWRDSCSATAGYAHKSCRGDEGNVHQIQRLQEQLDGDEIPLAQVAAGLAENEVLQEQADAEKHGAHPARQERCQPEHQARAVKQGEMGVDGWRIEAPGRRVAALLTEPLSKVARTIGKHEGCRIKQGADVRRPPSGDELHEQVVVTAHRVHDGPESANAIEYGARIADIA